MAQACFIGNMLTNGALHGCLWAAGLWDASQSGEGFPASGNSGSYAATAGACCYLLSTGGQVMPGEIVTTTTSDNLLILATTGGIMVTNGVTGQNSSTLNGAVSGTIKFGGLTNTTLTRLQLNPSNVPQGTTSTITLTAMTGGMEYNDSWPAESVTFYYPA